MIYHCLRVVQMNFPAAGVRELGELLAIHDGVGPSLIGRATLDGDVVGKSNGHLRSESDRTGAGSAVAISSSAADVARATDGRTSATSAAVAAMSRRRLS